MKAIIKEGKVQVPAEIRQKINLPENGECELLVDGNEVRIKPENKPPEAKEGNVLLSLMGLGKEIWEDVPADDYVNGLRNGWE